MSVPGSVLYSGSESKVSKTVGFCRIKSSLDKLVSLTILKCGNEEM
jgi:hypothetical protein